MPRIRFGCWSVALIAVSLGPGGCGGGGTTGLVGGFSGAEVSFGGGEDADDGTGQLDAAETRQGDAGDGDASVDIVSAAEISGDSDSSSDGVGDSSSEGVGDSSSDSGSGGSFADCGSGCDVLAPGGDVVGDAAGDGTGPGLADGVAADANASDAALGDAADVAGSDADAESSEPAPTPLSSCTGKEGDKACSADAKVRLECINGAWTPIAHCGFGICSEKENPSGPPTLLCSVPETTQATEASACARYLPCFAPEQGMEACMRAVLSPNLVASDVAKGIALPVAVAAMTTIGPVAACVAAATSCPTVAACLQPQNPPSCASASAAGCDAAFAYACNGGAPLVADCAAIGSSCLVIGSSPRCVVDQPCPAGNVSACDGRVATACVSTSAGNRAIQVDCGALGLSCAAGKAVLPAAEQACGAEVPCPAGLSASCAGGGPSQCIASKHVETSCATGEVCLYADEFDVGGLQCPPLSSCEAVRCSGSVTCSHAARCQGTEVWYCEQGQPRRFDCKTVGKSCTGGAAPRCG